MSDKILKVNLNFYIRIPENSNDEEIKKVANAFKETLNEKGIVGTDLLFEVIEQ